MGLYMGDDSSQKQPCFFFTISLVIVIFNVNYFVEYYEFWIKSEQLTWRENLPCMSMENKFLNTPNCIFDQVTAEVLASAELYVGR